MCGIAGIIDLEKRQVPHLQHNLKVMTDLQIHRGPDGKGHWVSRGQNVGFGHRRLSIIDLTSGGDQPMANNEAGVVITYNGEIYNYRELKTELKDYNFKTSSDTEVVLAAYLQWGPDCVKKFRGMFSFAIWDERQQLLFCARDQFGIKPFYYTIVDNRLYFASEVKALLPFVPTLEIDDQALREYLYFQVYLGYKTPFRGINELKAGHLFTVQGKQLSFQKYWEVYYNLDFEHSPKYFQEELKTRLNESIDLHLRSDVPVGAYVSGGIDSSAIAGLAKQRVQGNIIGFNGKFAAAGASFDESEYARAVGRMHDFPVHERDITSTDFENYFSKVIYHLDYPVAGPGSFAQYCISELASKHCKVVLGGQGGDEIFGGYTRYLIAYFEQCIKGAIDGSLNNGNFVVTYDSIIPNLKSLKAYKPMIKQFFSKGLFGPMDERYFQLINRSPDLGDEIRWSEFSNFDPFESFQKIFNVNNVSKESYFDRMTHFDFKTLLPGLLQVEDRMSMAHGIESRVPLLEPRIVEFAATMPADIKFKDGALKMVFVDSVKNVLPAEVLNRESKMGFPVPLNAWMKDELREFIRDIFGSQKAKQRQHIDNEKVLKLIDGQDQFGRKVWGLLSLEVWQQQFFDRHHEFKKMAKF